jgi:hypothetical protein
MKTKRVVLCGICLVLFLNGSWLIAAEEKQDYSNTRQTSAMIRIQANPSFLWIGDYESFTAICKPAIQQAFTEVYGNHNLSVDTDITFTFLGVMEGTGNDKAIQASIEIDLSSYEGIPMAAQEVKESFLNRLRENLNRSYEEYRQSLLGRQEAYERQVAQAEAQMNTLQEAILEITGGKKMSREFLEDQITGLSSELQEKEFEIGVHENRLKNLNNQIQEAEQYHREKQATNPIPAELEKKVASLEQQFQNMKRMAEAGQVSGQEIQEIEQHLIEARIELAERREMTEQSPEAQRIRELKEQLTQLSLSFSEQQMRMSFLREQIDNVRSLLERSTEYETLRIKADVQRKALYESIEQLERIQRENRLLTPPILTVISQ